MVAADGCDANAKAANNFKQLPGLATDQSVTLEEWTLNAGGSYSSDWSSDASR